MADALSVHVTRNRTPQSEPARADQVKNNAGGFTFKVDDKTTRLNRFLTIGVNGGTYHVSERDLTRDNAAVVMQLAREDYPGLVTEAVRVSLAGRAPSNNPALFAIAAAASLGSPEYRQSAWDALPQVARTGSHMITFIGYAEGMRGWGKQMTRGVNRWSTGWDWAEPRADGQPAINGLAYQLLKYKRRGGSDGWSQRDILRLALRKGRSLHGRGGRALGPQLTAEQAALFAYVMDGRLGEGLPQLVHSAAAAHATRNAGEWVNLIRGNRSLSWEMLPSEALREPDVWRALLDNGSLPQGALIRQLPRLTRLGVLTPGGMYTAQVASMLSNRERLARSRTHPVAVLLAMKTYAHGRSLRGKSTWTPAPLITDAMDAAFYEAFPAVEPTGQRLMLNLDISGTMSQSAGGLPITCREVVAGVAMVTKAVEPNASVWGFSATGGQWYGDRDNAIVPLDISPRRRLDDITSYIQQLPFGRTDCALPMVHALREGIAVDTFVIYTDNETWAGGIHPHQALAEYREKMGIDARLQVVCIVPTEFSIADPLDPRQLDVSGFDAAVPVLLADHARGALDPGYEAAAVQRAEDDGEGQPEED